MRRLVLLLAISLATAACGPGPSGDLDASTMDVPVAIDAGIDAPPPRSMCEPCRRDEHCDAGSICADLADGTSACVPACATDTDCIGLPLDARCIDARLGGPTACVPPSGACITNPIGAPCAASSDCTGTFDRCLEPEPGLGRYCTADCRVDADCPIGFRRCAPADGGRVCIRDPSSGPERCQTLLTDAGLVSCASRPCERGRCFTSSLGALCLEAPGASGCDDGLRAIETIDGPVCVPDARLAIDAGLPDCACLAAETSLLDEAALLAGRDRCTLRFPHALLDRFPPEIAHDVWRLSWTDPVHSDWLAPPALAREVSDTIDARSTDPSSTLLSIARRADLEVPESVSVPTPSASAASALVLLTRRAGGSPDEAAITAAIGALPAEHDRALAALFEAVVGAIEAREAALGSMTELEREALFDDPSSLFLAGFTRFGIPGSLRAAMRGDVDVGAMAAAAAEVLAAAQALAPLSGASLSALSIETPLGAIRIGGPGDDEHRSEAILLVLDVGGNDQYVGAAGGTASIDNGVAIAIDLGGRDAHGYVEVPVAADVGPAGHARLPSDGAGRARVSATSGPLSLSRRSRQGAGRLGIGLFVDLGPDDDTYRSLRMSQGYGALGVGVLFDEAGNDTYEGEAAVQGAAVAGVGLLLDGAGDDTHRAYHAAQGFAFTRGVGVLADHGGDDLYFAHPTDFLYYSPQSPGASNASFSQGVGFGRRDDAGGIYMSGGLGVLRDRDGSDRYVCGIFCQASGYWYGTGLLLEGGGDDHYDGEWYVQAGDAHFAIAVLWDESGNDRHNETAVRRNAAVGGGHDFSAAWVVDLSGDDVWRAPNLSLGVGHAGGFGAFVDGGGIDRYEAPSSLSFGSASIETPGDPARQMSGSVGVFIDRGGLDEHVRPEVVPIANDATWTQTAHTGESEAGAGIDRDGDTPLGSPLP